MTRFFGIALCLCMAVGCFAQKGDDGSLVIIADPKIDSLLDLHIKINTLYPQFPGWRVQIFFESGNNSKPLAAAAIEKFNKKHPDVRAHLLFESPYYKVRVGDFRSKIEAEKFLTEIRANYPNAFVTRDEIHFPDIR